MFIICPELLAYSHTHWEVEWKFPSFQILIRNKENNSDEYNKLPNLLLNDVEKTTFIPLFNSLYAIHESTVSTRKLWNRKVTFRLKLNSQVHETRQEGSVY